MQILMMLGLAMTAPVEPVVHDITVEHAGVPLEISYRADMDTRAKAVKVVLPNRVTTDQCRWVADVTVEREITRKGATPALTRTLEASKTIRGMRQGHCNSSVVREQVAEAVSNQAEAVKRHLVAVAEQDRPQLIADLEAARSLASN